MKLSKMIDYMEDMILSVVIYVDDDQEPIWEGKWCDIPYWIAKLHLIKPNAAEDIFPISYRHSLGEKYHNEPGLVIILTEEME